MVTILWLIAVVIAIAGIVSLFRGQILAGIVLLVIACAVGPGGWSIFREDNDNNRNNGQSYSQLRGSR